MTFVDPGVIGEGGARTQGGPIAVFYRASRRRGSAPPRAARGHNAHSVRASLWPPRPHRVRQERLLRRAQALVAVPLEDRLQPAELEAREPDPPRCAHDFKAEVGEEVLREHRLVDT